MSSTFRVGWLVELLPCLHQNFLVPVRDRQALPEQVQPKRGRSRGRPRELGVMLNTKKDSLGRPNSAESRRLNDEMRAREKAFQADAVLRPML